MLPVIELCAIDICETGFSPHTGKVELIGNAFWFSWNAVVEAARKASLNIDRFLTIRLGLFIVKKKPKSNIVYDVNDPRLLQNGYIPNKAL